MRCSSWRAHTWVLGTVMVKAKTMLCRTGWHSGCRWACSLMDWLPQAHLAKGRRVPMTGQLSTLPLATSHVTTLEDSYSSVLCVGLKVCCFLCTEDSVEDLQWRRMSHPKRQTEERLSRRPVAQAPGIGLGSSGPGMPETTLLNVPQSQDPKLKLPDTGSHRKNSLEHWVSPNPSGHWMTPFTVVA